MKTKEQIIEVLKKYLVKNTHNKSNLYREKIIRASDIESIASELTEKESEIRTAEEFIRSRIKNELTFNAFDTVQQYPICMIAEWAYEFSLQQPEKEQPSDEPDISTYPEKFQRWVYNNIRDDYSNHYLAFLYSIYDADYDRLKT